MSGLIARGAVTAAVRSDRLMANTAWMCARGAVRIVLQAAYFVIVARVLGAAGYGEFIAVAALAAMLAPFGSFGTGNLLVRDVSREPQAMADSWSTAMITTALAGLVLTTTLVAVAAYVLPNAALVLVALIGVADLVFAQFSDLCGKAFQAQQRLDVTATLDTVLSLAKLVAAVALYAVVATPTPLLWAWFYAAANGVAATIALVVVFTRHRRLAVRGQFSLRSIKEGMYFALSQWTQAVQKDIDKMLIVRFSGVHAAGIYGAAARIVDITFTPVLSLLSATYPGFFRHGAAGLQASVSFGRPLVVMAGLYGLVTGLALFLAAPLLPLVLGASFEGSVHAVQCLAVLPFLRALHYVAGDVLTGAGFQRWRAALQILAGATAVVLALAVIPVYSWRGAAAVAVASNVLLVAVSWIAIARLRRTA